MNRNKLKQYAPQARRDFIAAITDRAAYYGLTKQHIQPITEQGDVALIGGKPFPRHVAEKRRRLEGHIKRRGFEQVMEALAYTWFNRLVAIRFMELHGYLDHGYRVLRHPEGKPTPEILEHAEHVDLPGLKKETVIDLKLAGNKERELYRLLLTAQCNALHTAMPFLFEKIDDETELLLPENLLHSDSLIRNLVREIDEEDWQEVEIIGWLYQFYISEKKDQVIGKVVASEDIPAATQLFTPNWIVKYLVQNTLGRQWLETYPQSALRQRMEYYIEPAEQTPDAQEQLKAITPTSLNPEELTLLDPACGSGHILVEAYDLFKAIYQERGYRARDIPALILQKNLFGLEIDDRAAQLAAFSLMMKARRDDRRIFSAGIQPHVLAIQESKGLDTKEIIEGLNASLGSDTSKVDTFQADLVSLIELFRHGKTFGSLICLPDALTKRLEPIQGWLQDSTHGEDFLVHLFVNSLIPIIAQANLLSTRFDVFITNPPYMGSSYFAPILREFVRENYEEGKQDLYACFLLRNLIFAKKHGHVALITIPNWMFLSGFEKLRHRITLNTAISSFIYNGRGVWGSDFGSCSFSLLNTPLPNYRGDFRRLFERYGSVASNEELCRRFFEVPRFKTTPADLERVPGSPFSFWASTALRSVFESSIPLSNLFTTRLGISTANNDKFLRLWWEVSIDQIMFNAVNREEALNSGLRWFPYQKGGPFRKWYGNNEFVVNWAADGYDVLNFGRDTGRIRSHNYNLDFSFREGVTWSDVTSANNAFRHIPPGFLFDGRGSSGFGATAVVNRMALGLLNSKVSLSTIKVLNPTIALNVGEVGRVPLHQQALSQAESIAKLVSDCIAIAKHDWDLYETSGLDGELSPEVPADEITLSHPNREEVIRRLISYALGCWMGRYTLDKLGLIYAHSDNKGFDSNQYAVLPADADGIIPLTELEWFDDSAANRLDQFIATAWPREHLEENLKFIADSLDPNRNERPRETIRRYLATIFYKHHLSMYKRRPIYWLFSSGKQRAFQCLVYLHRYNESTLARMRTEYVIPLQGKISSRIAQLADDIAAASSTSHRKKLEKERDTLVKQQAELHTFDEKLRHYADKRISLHLDDGVKVNYGKFGDLLADVKAVTGGTEEP